MARLLVLWMIVIAVGFMAIMVHVVSVAVDHRLSFEACVAMTVFGVAIAGYLRPR